MPVAILNNGTFNTTAVSPWPDATNTGYRNAPGYPGSLAAGGTIASGQTFSFKDYNGGAVIGSPGTPVSDVTFTGCRFRVNSQDQCARLWANGPVTFQYCSFEPLVAGPPVAYADSYQFGILADGSWGGTFCAALTVQNCDLWGFGNAISCTGSTQAAPHVYRDNWIHDASADGGVYHTDGIGDLANGTTFDSYVVLHHNTIMSAGNTNGVAYQGGATPGNFDHFTVTNNLFSGFGKTVDIYGGTSGTTTNITFTDNVFSTALLPDFGPLYNATMAGNGGLWRRNTWHVPAGAAWGNPAHDGWYWMPVDSNISGTDDTQFVSLTDYAG